MEDFRKQFEELLFQTILPEGISDEDFDKSASELLSLVNSNLPEELYKYRACNENSFDAFDKDTLWASQPLSFNDPHDCLPYCDENKVKEAINLHSTMFIRSIKETGTVPEIIPQIFGKENTEKVNMIERYKNITEDEIKEEIKNNLEQQSFDENFSFFRRDFEANHQIKSKVVSLCGKFDSSLMWAHYADYHKGFILGYKTPIRSKCDTCENTTCQNKKFSVLFPVIYSQQRYDITEMILYHLSKQIYESSGNDFTDPIPDQLYRYKINIRKSTDWNYEDEWRLLCNCPNPNIIFQDRMVISGIIPTKIYYGARISDINRKILSEISKQKGLQQFQMRIDNNGGTYGIYAENMI